MKFIWVMGPSGTGKKTFIVLYIATGGARPNYQCRRVWFTPDSGSGQKLR